MSAAIPSKMLRDCVRAAEHGDLEAGKLIAKVACSMLALDFAELRYALASHHA